MLHRQRVLCLFFRRWICLLLNHRISGQHISSAEMVRMHLRMKILSFKNSLFALILVIAGCNFSFSQQPSNPQIAIKQFVLSNGLTVILNEDHTKPQVFGVVVTKAGAKNDPADATGLAHYQEHMLFKGTQTLGTTNWDAERPHIEKIFNLYEELSKTTVDSLRKKIQKQINEESVKANEYAIPNELDKIIKLMGGTYLNANTDYDRTVYFNAFPAGQIEKWLELYSERFINPVFRSFQAELEVVYEEKNLYSDMFQMNLLESFQSKFFKVHPYGRPIVGTINHLKNPSLNKMFDFFKTYYVPNNMALILSGDFKTEEVIPLIEAKFGKWQSKPVPVLPVFKEDSFKGREFFEAKMSPIKLEILGFRTVPNGDQDEIALQICNKILSNENQTGLLDKLSMDNKLIAAVNFPMEMNDYGASVFFIVPKIVGQSLESAEKLVLTELDKLKKGEFEDWMVEAFKNELYRNFELKMESIEGKATTFAEIFAQNISIDDYLSYPEKIKRITKEDIIRVANKYYGNNYLAFYSKMGSPKKEKIDKPGYKPVISNMNAKSAFAEKLENIQAKTPEIKYIDFQNDIVQKDILPKERLFYVKNPKNDIFSLTIKFGIGNTGLPMLKYASQMMNYAGSEGKDVKKLKEEFSKIGCTYSISSDESYLVIYLEGIESNINPAIALINELINKPILDQKKLKILIEGEKANRKMESSEPDNVADALFDYVRYQNKSSYIDRLTMKELQKLKAEDLIKTYKEALTYQVDFHYCGTIDPSVLIELFRKNIQLAPELKNSNSPVVVDLQNYNENIVYLVDKKKAIQSKIYLFANGENYDKQNDPFIDAFNLYFGGDFSGLVLQEIREYRSLAYGAGARYTIPLLAGKKTSFYGYVGTQADKTLEALDVFDTLIHHMPEKPERMEMIREYLVQSRLASKPDFRELSQTVESWKYRGYIEDPLKMKLPAYQSLNFSNITSFYHLNIEKKPLVIAIVGDKSRIDMKSLARYGKIIELKEKSLFKK